MHSVLTFVSLVAGVRNAVYLILEVSIDQRKEWGWFVAPFEIRVRFKRTHMEHRVYAQITRELQLVS